MPLAAQSQRTDSLGRFVFRDVPTNVSLILRARKEGFVGGGYGQDAPAGMASDLQLTPTQWLPDVNLRVWRAGAIEGSVFVPDGRPAIGVPVRAIRVISVAGSDQLETVTTAKADDRGQYRLAGLLPGRYFVGTLSQLVTVPTALAAQVGSIGLQPGEVPPSIAMGATSRLLSTATVPSRREVGGHLLVSPAVFYPGSGDLSAAAAIDLLPAATQSGIDLHLREEPGVVIDGTIDGPTDRMAHLVVRLLPVGMAGLAAGNESGLARVDNNGHFILVGITPGDYLVDVSSWISGFHANDQPSASMILANLPFGFAGMGGVIAETPVSIGPSQVSVLTLGAGSSAVWARQRISVGHDDIKGVVLTLQRTASIHGTVNATGSQRPGVPVKVRIVAEPADGFLINGISIATREFSANVGADFDLVGLAPGNYFIRVKCASPNCPWIANAIDLQGVDLMTHPLDASGGNVIGDVRVVLGDNPARLEGLIHPLSGRALGVAPSDQAVVVFPSNSDRWTHFGLDPPDFLASIPSSTGQYAFPNLPAGDYNVAVIPRSDVYSWKTPTALRALAGAATHVRLEWGGVRSLDIVFRDSGGH